MKKYFCPKCKSTNVIKEMNALLQLGAPQRWGCEDCGYNNFIFPEKEIKPKINRNKK